MDFATDNNKACEMDNMTKSLLSNANTETTGNNKLEMDASGDFFGMTGDHNNHHHHLNDKLNNIIDLNNAQNPFDDFVESGGHDEHNFGLIDNKEHALMSAGMEKACLETDGDMGPETSVDITDDADTDPLECSTLSHSKETLPSTDNPFDINNKAGLQAFDSDNLKDIHDKSTAPISPCTDMPFDSDIQSSEMYSNQGDNFYEKRDDLHLGEDNFKTDDDDTHVKDLHETDIDQLDREEIKEHIEVGFCGSMEAAPSEVSEKADMAYNQFAEYIEQPLQTNAESRESLDEAVEGRQAYSDLLDDPHHGEEHLNGTQSLTPAQDTPASISPAPESPVPHNDYDSMIDHGERSDHEQLDQQFVDNFDEIREQHLPSDGGNDLERIEEEKHIVDDILMEQEKHENELQENEKHTDDFMHDILATAKTDEGNDMSENIEKDVHTLEQPFVSDTIENLQAAAPEHDAEMIGSMDERFELGPPHEIDLGGMPEVEMHLDVEEQITEQKDLASHPTNEIEFEESHTKETVDEHMLENLESSHDNLDQMENVHDHVESLTTNDDNDFVVDSQVELHHQEQTMEDKLPSLEHNEEIHKELDTILNEKEGIETMEFEVCSSKSSIEPTLLQSVGEEALLSCATDAEPKVDEREIVVETVEKVESFISSQEPEELIKKEDFLASIEQQFDEQLGTDKNLSDFGLNNEIDDMSSQLNPDAKEFVPTSPTPFDSMKGIGVLSAVPACLNGDDVIAQSPQKGGGYSMENIVVPNEADFDLEVSHRPADMDDEVKPSTPLLPLQVQQCINGDDLIAQSPQRDATMNDFKVPTPSEFVADVVCRPSELHDSPQTLNLKEAMHEPEKEQVSPMEQDDSSLNESVEIGSPVDTSLGKIEDMLNTVQMLPNEEELETDVMHNGDFSGKQSTEPIDDGSLVAEVNNLKLVEETSQPVFEFSPVAEEPKLYDHAEPVAEEPMQLEEHAPTPEMSAPAIEEPASVIEEHKQIEEPVLAESAAPPMEEAKPIFETIKPIIDLSKPIVEEKIAKTTVEKVNKAADTKKIDSKTKSPTSAGVKKTTSTTSSTIKAKPAPSTTTAAKPKVGAVSAPRPRTIPLASKPASAEKKTPTTTTQMSARAKLDVKSSPTGLKKLPLTKPKTDDSKPAVKQVASKVMSTTRTTTAPRSATTTSTTATAKRTTTLSTPATKNTTGARPLSSTTNKPSTLASAHKPALPRTTATSTLRKSDTLKSPTKPPTSARSTTNSASTVSKTTSRTSGGSSTTTTSTTRATTTTTTKRLTATATSKTTVASSTTAKKPLLGVKKPLGSTTTTMAASKVAAARKSATSPLTKTKAPVDATKKPISPIKRPVARPVEQQQPPVVAGEESIEIKMNGMNGNASPLAEHAPEEIVADTAAAAAAAPLAVTANGDMMRED